MSYGVQPKWFKRIWNGQFWSFCFLLVFLHQNGLKKFGTLNFGHSKFLPVFLHQNGSIQFRMPSFGQNWPFQIVFKEEIRNGQNWVFQIVSSHLVQKKKKKKKKKK